MGDVNQLLYVQSIADRISGPILEIGSRNYGNTQDLRSLFSDRGEYVGIDMSDGKGVDLVLDMTEDFEVVDAALKGKRFGTIFCMSVLEHCAQPFRMADNITRLLKPDGCLCVSVPFAWQFHGYPSDYWRFTHEGVKQLFDGIDFSDQPGASVTSRKGDFRSLDSNIGKIPLSGGYYRKRGQWLRSIAAGCGRFLTRLGIGRWLFGYRYVMAPTMITMMGTPRKSAESKTAA
ncbi:MAG: hypothetical protein Tsb009_05060 [Planctomycetaceae bacterium]